MSWGDRAAEQREKDRPSLADINEMCSFCGATGATVGIGDDGVCINTYKCQERHDQLESR